jgi:hypothetical protein
MAPRSHLTGVEDDATMAPETESEMQGKFDKLQTALTTEIRTQLEAVSAKLEGRVERVEGSLTHRLKVQSEELREIVKTAADNYGGVLDGLQREIKEFRAEWRKDSDKTKRILTNHARRIEALERVPSTERR